MAGGLSKNRTLTPRGRSRTLLRYPGHCLNATVNPQCCDFISRLSGQDLVADPFGLRSVARVRCDLPDQLRQVLAAHLRKVWPALAHANRFDAIAEEHLIPPHGRDDARPAASHHRRGRPGAPVADDAAALGEEPDVADVLDEEDVVLCVVKQTGILFLIE